MKTFDNSTKNIKPLSNEKNQNVLNNFKNTSNSNINHGKININHSKININHSKINIKDEEKILMEGPNVVNTHRVIFNIIPKPFDIKFVPNNGKNMKFIIIKVLFCMSFIEYFKFLG